MKNTILYLKNKNFFFKRTLQILGRLIYPDHFPANSVRVKLYRKLGFNNTRTLLRNITWKAYHIYCRSGYSKTAKKDDMLHSAFLNNGYYVFPPSSSSSQVLNSLPEGFCETLLDKAKLGVEGVDDDFFNITKLHHFDQNEFQIIKTLLDDETINAIRSIFDANFLVLSAYTSRSIPPLEKRELKSSWLWHADNHPDCMIKVFFYLNDTDSLNAALQIHPRSSSREIFNLGFIDRNDVSPSLKLKLDDDNRYMNLEGKRGTRIFFDDNNIHRAVIAKERCRDVVVFEIIPSRNSDIQYMELHSKYWKNPFTSSIPLV